MSVPPKALKNRTILVVDDDLPSQRLVAAALADEECTTRFASSAEEALSILPSLKPHLMIVDLALPKLNGTDLTRIVKSDQTSSDIVVVLVSSRNGRDVEREAMAAGCSAYWRKPIDAVSLPHLLAGLLEV